MAKHFIPSVFVDRLVSQSSKTIEFPVKSRSNSRSNRAMPHLLGRRHASVGRKDAAENAKPVDATRPVQASIPSSKESVPRGNSMGELIASLRCEGVSSRYHAAERLATLGRDAKHAIPELLRVLREDENALVRKSAALALGEIGVTVDILVEGLKRSAECDTDKFVRQRAAHALERLESVEQTS